MKKNRSDIEFYRNMMDMLQQEKASLREQLDAERKSREKETKQILEENRALREELIRLTEQLRKREENEVRREAEKEELMNRILILQTDLTNAMAALRLGRGKRFAPTSEKMSQVDKDRLDKRADEKDDFDGTPPSSESTGEGECDRPSVVPTPKRRKKRSAGRKKSIEDYSCDEVVRHKLEEYFRLPEGAVFKTRNGEVETHEWVSFEFVPGRVIKHIWETASYQDAVGDFHNTLPEEERHNPVKGCPFNAEMLAYILVEKYAYHSSKNGIKKKLREMGAIFSKSTFVRYYSLAAGALRDMLGDVWRRSITQAPYLMIDETCELVAVIDPETGLQQYKKRYLWAFHDPASAMVMYLYEKGSRARKVVTDLLKDFRGTITTDGYGAYRIFDTGEHRGVLHCGCWAHVRRKVLEALGVASDICRELLADIDDLFLNERLFRGLDSKSRKKQRIKLSRTIVNRIFNTIDRLAADATLMGKDLLRKAINYIKNQKESLRNFLRDGQAELSNNYCEQRMKPIKLDLKNCQNIGSETAAECAAFMHSIVESCRMNGKNPYDYLVDLFHKLKKPLDDIAKRELLPDRWQPQC